jgi:hypothetical protein
VIALVLCGLAFVGTLAASRRSLVAGISAMLAVGYMYGIIRANLPTTITYFLFDISIVGLYLGQIGKRVNPLQRERERQLRQWVALLVGWPFLLLLFPIQDPMIQLVGFRAHVFFLPLLLFGARLDRSDLDRLTRVIAILTLVSFAFAVAEFVLGVPRFYPFNDVTRLIYRSNDIRLEGSLVGLFRIPATFVNAAAYGGTMVISVPFLLGALFRPGKVRHRPLLAAALAAAIMGTFFAAARTNLLILGVLLIASLLSGQLGRIGRMAWVVMLGGVGLVVAANPRLFQRLLSISPDAVLERLSWSMNRGVLELVSRYPMGNGLGGGGNSIPGFLAHLLRNPLHVENQYATIMLEQGLPGLLIWFAFILWVLTRRGAPKGDPWYLGRRLARLDCAAFLATGFIGVGLFTSIPQTPLLLLAMGWISVVAAEPDRPVGFHEADSAAPALVETG